MCPIDNKSGVVQVMAWRRLGAEQLGSKFHFFYRQFKENNVFSYNACYM